MVSSKPQTGERMAQAVEAGQMPPTDAMPVRQRYQMGCEGMHGGGGNAAAGVSRQPTSSRQFNRGAATKPRRPGY